MRPSPCPPATGCYSPSSRCSAWSAVACTPGTAGSPPSATRFAWYPDQVWRWLLACQWRRLDQEEPFVQRTAEAGDDLGSAVIAARLVRDTIRVRAARATAQRARPDRAARPVGVAVPRPPGPGARRRPVHRRLPGDGHRPLPARTAADRRDRPV